MGIRFGEAKLMFRRRFGLYNLYNTAITCGTYQGGG
jgi:hypothetical protein